MAYSLYSSVLYLIKTLLKVNTNLKRLLHTAQAPEKLRITLRSWGNRFAVRVGGGSRGFSHTYNFQNTRLRKRADINRSYVACCSLAVRNEGRSPVLPMPRDAGDSISCHGAQPGGGPTGHQSRCPTGTVGVQGCQQVDEGRWSIGDVSRRYNATRRSGDGSASHRRRRASGVAPTSGGADQP